MARKKPYEAVREHADGRKVRLRYEEKIIRGETILLETWSEEEEAVLAATPKRLSDALGPQMALLVHAAKPGEPLLAEAPRCDNAHGCGKMRERDEHVPALVEDDHTQLSLYVCRTKGCPFEGVPYQIRERLG